MYSYWLLVTINNVLSHSLFFFRNSAILCPFYIYLTAVECKVYGSAWTHAEWYSDNVKLNCKCLCRCLKCDLFLTYQWQLFEAIILSATLYLLSVPLWVAKVITFKFHVFLPLLFNSEGDDGFRAHAFSDTAKLNLNLISLGLTVMVDGVDEPDSYVCVVVRHQNNIEQLLTLWVQLS